MSSMSELDAIRCELGLTEDQANAAIQGACSFAHAVALLHDAAGEDSPVVLPPCDPAEASTELPVDMESLRSGFVVQPGHRLSHDDRYLIGGMMDDVYNYVFELVESKELEFDTDDASRAASAAANAINAILCQVRSVHAL